MKFLIDFDDLRYLLDQPGRSAAGVGTGLASSSGDVTRDAINHAALGAEDLALATGLYVSICSGVGTLRLSTNKAMMNTIREQAPLATSMIYHSSVEQSLGENMKLLIVASGLPLASESECKSVADTSV